MCEGIESEQTCVLLVVLGVSRRTTSGGEPVGLVGGQGGHETGGEVTDLMAFQLFSLLDVG